MKEELKLHRLLMFLIFLLDLIHPKEFVDDLENIYLNKFISVLFFRLILINLVQVKEQNHVLFHEYHQ